MCKRNKNSCRRQEDHEVLINKCPEEKEAEEFIFCCSLYIYIYIYLWSAGAWLRGIENNWSGGVRKRLGVSVCPMSQLLSLFYCSNDKKSDTTDCAS